MYGVRRRTFINFRCHKRSKKRNRNNRWKNKGIITGDNNISVAPFQGVEYDNVLLSSIKEIVGKPIKISLGGYEMDSGEIQFSYNENQLGNISEEKLTIYWLDTENKEIVPVPKDKITIDKDSNTITGLVDHFSIYFLGEENIEKDPTNVDIVFTIDQSLSMDDSDPNFVRLLATKKFIQEIDKSENNRFGIVEFAGNANVIQSLTNDKDVLIKKLDDMRYTDSYTNLGDGLLESGELFDSIERFKTIIFLTDGCSNRGLSNDEILEVSRAITANNIMINTIGLGSDVDSDFLLAIAGIGKGEFFDITTDGKSREQIDAELELVYTKLAKQIALREKAPYDFNPRALLNPIEQVKSNLYYLGYTDVYDNYSVALDSFLNDYYEISSNKKARELYEEINEKDRLNKLVELTCNAFTSIRIKRAEYVISITGVTDQTIKCSVENGTGKTLELYDITAENIDPNVPGRLINKIKITESDKEVVFSDLTAKTKYAIMLKDESQKILAYRNITTRENNQGTYIFVGVPKVQGVKGYILDSGEQVIKGSFTDKVTLLGTAGQVALSLTGVDFVADVRDVSADLINWEWTWVHVGQTTLDGIGLVPIIGVIKNGDEVALLFRSGKKIDEAIDALDEGSKYISKQFMKEVEQAGSINR